MYKSIVVGSDGSSTSRGAVAEAAGLARAFEVPLHVVCAYGVSGGAVAAASMAASGMLAAEWDLSTREHVEAQLNDLAATLRGDGVKVETYAVPGSPVDALIDVAATSGSNLIVVGSKGMKGARRILGSVPNAVAHHADCAVLIVKTC